MAFLAQQRDVLSRPAWLSAFQIAPDEPPDSPRLNRRISRWR